jgi:TolA-binding protein
LKMLVRIVIIMALGALVAVGLVHFDVAGANRQWQRLRAWGRGQQSDLKSLPGLDEFLQPLGRLVDQWKQEAASAQARLEELRQQAGAVMDAALEQQTRAEEERLRIQRREAELAGTELHEMAADAAAAEGDNQRGKLHERASLALQAHQAEIGRCEAANAQKREAIRREIERRVRLYNALDASEKAAFRGLPNTLAFDEKWVAAIHGQLQAHGLPGDQIRAAIARRRQQALKAGGGGNL